MIHDIDDKRWDEHMNRVIGQLGRYAHAEIRRMAAEARAQFEEPTAVHAGDGVYRYDLRKYVTGAKWIDYEARVVDGVVVERWENGRRVCP